MKMNWDEGFRRVRYAFITITWLIFIVAQFSIGSTAREVAENFFGTLVFTVCAVLFARICIWVVRGFLGGGNTVKS